VFCILVPWANTGIYAYGVSYQTGVAFIMAKQDTMK
jgi:hypothetical protein